MKKLLLIILLAISGITLFAATVEHVKTFSASMNKVIDAVVITPVDYPGEQPCPVLYLLHGHGGNHNNWVTRVPEIKEYADRYNFFYQVNLNLHKKLLERNIPHDFTVRPGGHSWEYWGNSVAFQAPFFHRFFTKQLTVSKSIPN